MSKFLETAENMRRKGKAVAYAAYDVVKEYYGKTTSDSGGKQRESLESEDSVDKIGQELKKIDVWQPGVPPKTLTDGEMDKMRKALTQEDIGDYRENNERYIAGLKKSIKEISDDFNYSSAGVRSTTDQMNRMKSKIKFLKKIPDLRKEREILMKQMRDAEEMGGKLTELNRRLTSLGGDKETAEKIGKLIEKHRKRRTRREELIGAIDTATRGLFVDHEEGLFISPGQLGTGVNRSGTPEIPID